MPHPRREISQLAIISVIGHPHLRSNKENFTIVNNNATVVNDALVGNRPVMGRE